MARAQGARAQMALAFETVYGTPSGSGFTQMPFITSALAAEQPLLASELLDYGREPRAPTLDAITTDGDVEVPIDAVGFGFWLKAAFGNPVTTGVEPWTHEFRSGSWTLPSMSIETGMPEVPRYAMYSGCVLDQISWQMQRAGFLTATERLVAQAEREAICRRSKEALAVAKALDVKLGNPNGADRLKLKTFSHADEAFPGSICPR